MESASGTSSLWTSVGASLKGAVRNPLAFVRSPPYLWIVAVYGTTYVTVCGHPHQPPPRPPRPVVTPLPSKREERCVAPPLTPSPQVNLTRTCCGLNEVDPVAPTLVTSTCVNM